MITVTNPIKTVIQGQIVKYDYKFIESCEKNKGKPNIEIKAEMSYDNLIEINEFIDIDKVSNKPHGIYIGSYGMNLNKKIYLNEVDEVIVLKQIYRADINTLFIQTSKIIDEECINKEEVENKYNIAIKKYYYNQIKEDKRLFDYCTLHNLDMHDIDEEKYYKLYEIIYNNSYSNLNIDNKWKYVAQTLPWTDITLNKITP